MEDELNVMPPLPSGEEMERQVLAEELARKFGCVRSTVHRALNMEMDTPLGNEIRRAAMEMGGVFAMKVKFIEC